MAPNNPKPGNSRKEILPETLKLVLKSMEAIFSNPAFAYCPFGEAKGYAKSAGYRKDISLGFLCMAWQTKTEFVMNCVKCGAIKSVYVYSYEGRIGGDENQCFGGCINCEEKQESRFEDFSALEERTRKAIDAFQSKNVYWTEEQFEKRRFSWGGLKTVKEKMLVLRRKTNPVSIETLGRILKGEEGYREDKSDTAIESYSARDYALKKSETSEGWELTMHNGRPTTMEVPGVFKQLDKRNQA